MDVVTALTILVSVTIISLVFKYVNLHLKVNNFIDLQLKAEKSNQNIDEKNSCELDPTTGDN